MALWVEKWGDWTFVLKFCISNIILWATGNHPNSRFSGIPLSDMVFVELGDGGGVF